MSAIRDHGAAAGRRAGILGGMGPAATLHFARDYLDACMQILRGGGRQVDDQSLPPHWIAQAAVPDRTAALVGGGPSPLPALLAALRKLAAAGADVVAMPCNTAHAWHERLQRELPDVEFLHIAAQAAHGLGAQRLSRVGLLATRGTLAAGIYQEHLADGGIEAVVPTHGEQDSLMRAIYEGVKAGDEALAGRLLRQATLEMAKRRDVDGFLMACTELPLALAHAGALPVRVFDAGRMLAEALARRTVPAAA